MLENFIAAHSKLRPLLVDIVAVIVITAIIAIAGIYVYDKVTYKVPISEIPATQSITPQTVETAVNNALAKAGSQNRIDSREASEITKQIEYRTVYTQPDYSFKVPDFSTNTMRQSDQKIQQIAKEEKRDEVIKHQVDDKTINYYGITNEKKIAWGIYADLDKDGSKGIYFRQKRTTVSAGQKYDGGGITGRVMQDLIQH